MLKFNIFVTIFDRNSSKEEKLMWWKKEKKIILLEWSENYEIDEFRLKFDHESGLKHLIYIKCN